MKIDFEQVVNDLRKLQAEVAQSFHEENAHWKNRGANMFEAIDGFVKEYQDVLEALEEKGVHSPCVVSRQGGKLVAMVNVFDLQETDDAREEE